MILSRRKVLALAGAAALPIPTGLAGGKASGFAALSKRWLTGMLALGPVNATALGDHHHDTALDDLSPAGRIAASTFSNKILTELGRIDITTLPRAEQVDAKMLQNALRFDLWSREVLKDWSWDPLIY